MRKVFFLEVADVKLSLLINESILDSSYNYFLCEKLENPDFFLDVREDIDAERTNEKYFEINVIKKNETIFLDSTLFEGWLDLEANRGIFHQIPGARDYRVALQVMLSHVCAGKNTFFFHGASISYGRKGYLFVGPSGAGKTTIAKLSDGEVLCDETSCVKILQGKKAILCGTPLGNSSSSGFVPLKKIFWIEQSEIDKEELLDPKEAMKLLFSQIIVGAGDREQKERLFLLITKLLSSVPVYRLEFTLSPNFMNFLSA